MQNPQKTSKITKNKNSVAKRTAIHKHFNKNKIHMNRQSTKPILAAKSLGAASTTSGLTFAISSANMLILLKGLQLKPPKHLKKRSANKMKITHLTGVNTKIIRITSVRTALTRAAFSLTEYPAIGQTPGITIHPPWLNNPNPAGFISK
jgi:hypothetical protein